MSPSRPPHTVHVVVAIDTEEDNWGTYDTSGATVRNITLLPILQDHFDRWGTRATYFVNWPPLHDRTSVQVLRTLAERTDVEIGTHCHVWNTPPYTGSGEGRSMMWMFPAEVLADKIRNLTEVLRAELGVHPRAFRSGKWGFGTTVALALRDQGYLLDSSVTPFIDWSADGGPNYSAAPNGPYRFEPEQPLTPDPSGSMIEIPTTIGFLRGPQTRSGRWRHSLEEGFAARLGVVGALDRAGLLTRRWLSPEGSTRAEMVQLAKACVQEGAQTLVVSLHSSVLLPGATPFVASEADRVRFLTAMDGFLEYCVAAGFRFATLSEAADAVARA